MTVLAKGSGIPWAAKQSARPEHIRQLGNDVIEFRLVRGQLRKGVLRSEWRVTSLYSPSEALKLKVSYYFTLKTDVNFDGDLVLSQLPWDGNSPDNSIRLNTKTKRMYYLNYNQGGRPKRREETLVPTVQVDREYKIAYLLEAEENGRGSVTVYLDGEKKVDLKGQVLFPPLDKSRYPKVGQYLDSDLPSGTNEVVVQFRDITFYSTDATAEEMLGRIEAPQEPEEPNEPDPEINEPDPEAEEPEPEIPDIFSELEDLETELSQISDSLSRIRNTVREIHGKF